MIPGLRGGRLRAGFLAGLFASLTGWAAAAETPPLPPVPQHTLARARQAGTLSCGVVVEQEDFNKSDTHGDLSGFGAAICRAIAAAALGDPGRATLVGFPDDAHALEGLRHRRIALLIGTTPEATMAMLHHLRFSPTLFVDGQGFLVPRGLGARRPADLRDRLVCFLGETGDQVALTEWRARTEVPIRLDPYEESGEMQSALLARHCDAITADVSSLAGMRAHFGPRSREFEILPEEITYDPFAAATRDDDLAWTTLVADVVTALIEAEQSGISRATLAGAARKGDPAATRLLGPTPGLRSLLGLEDGWATRAIAAGGNYGEILWSTTGQASPLGLARGRNALWNAGGMIAAPVFP